MTNEEYYEYHESKHSLMVGASNEPYFKCEVCNKDHFDSQMSEELNVCKDCFDDVVQLECKCGHKYWATTAVAKKIDEGKLENLGPCCDGSHQPEGDDR